MSTTPYFIGIALPPHIEDTIVRAQRELLDTRSAIQPLVPHITLLHPPAVERMEPDELAARIHEATADMTAVPVTLEGFGSFDRRSVYIRARQTPELMQLHHLLVSLLPKESRQQHYPDDSIFTPHITLVQAKRGGKLSPNLLAEYTAELEHLLPFTFEVAHLTLYRWTAPRQYELQTI